MYSHHCSGECKCSRNEPIGSRSAPEQIHVRVRVWLLFRDRYRALSVALRSERQRASRARLPLLRSQRKSAAEWRRLRRRLRMRWMRRCGRGGRRRATWAGGRGSSSSSSPAAWAARRGTWTRRWMDSATARSRSRPPRARVERRARRIWPPRRTSHTRDRTSAAHSSRRTSNCSPARSRSRRRYRFRLPRYWVLCWKEPRQWWRNSRLWPLLEPSLSTRSRRVACMNRNGIENVLLGWRVVVTYTCTSIWQSLDIFRGKWEV